ncbi:trimeric intracellular cation channel family protein [Ramlibacter tataouinensis]|uniref:trimeric intracellular cation channel family protein n=1 Tax=Ramlibacter tataouinensis TaxID=94132 RepID=UPI0022F37F24|nr:trimeric intracellular cation channel family protein [Ramlibacter tataouinensis]WBY01123.1 trimeric intracellular cation channel family protein [Ramlibacter tataouinensis]
MDAGLDTLARSAPWLPYALDLAGTFVFAISGAMAGIRQRVDVFGVLVLSFVAANTGGITRDILIGAVPPAAIRDWNYLGVSLAAGFLTFCFPSVIRQRWNPVLVFDAAGLALFAVTGADKALAYGLDPVMATVLGMLTGIGGGMARDVLLREIPTVLRADLYAVAALAGAAVVVVAHRLQLPYGLAALVGGALCFALRVLAIRRGWQLPRATGHEPGMPGAGAGQPRPDDD